MSSSSITRILLWVIGKGCLAATFSCSFWNFALVAGRYMRKVVPIPISGSKVITPPWALMMEKDVASPSRVLKNR